MRGGDKTYHKSEILFSFVKQLLLPGMNQNRVLCIPTFGTNIFYKDNTKRDLDYLVYFGKHKKIKGYPEDKIIYEDKPDNHIELGNLLRRCNKLITYDSFTALIFEATLCGCPVVIVPDNFRKKEDIENSEFGFNGVTWEDTQEGFLKARESLPKAQAVLEQLEKQSKKSLNNFITITQQSAQNAGKIEAPSRIPYFILYFRLRKLYKESR